MYKSDFDTTPHPIAICEGCEWTPYSAAWDSIQVGQWDEDHDFTACGVCEQPLGDRAWREGHGFSY